MSGNPFKVGDLVQSKYDAHKVVLVYALGNFYGAYSDSMFCFRDQETAQKLCAGTEAFVRYDPARAEERRIAAKKAALEKVMHDRDLAIARIKRPVRKLRV